jgi:hypothetical protein
MKWQATVVGPLASALVAAIVVPTTAAFAVVITRDMGGEITSYLRKFEGMRDSGERLVIDGPCLSACTF